MHGPTTSRVAWSAGGSPGTLRIAAWTSRPLEDGTATLDDATGTGGRGWALGRDRTRWRRTVDGPGAGLRHDHTLDRHCRRCGYLRSLWRSHDGRGWRRSRSEGRSRRWCNRGRRSCRNDGTGRGRAGGRRRSNRGALCRRYGGRGSGDGRTGDHGASGRLRGNGRGRRRRRGYDRGRLARLGHDNAARRRSFGLGRGWRADGRNGRGSNGCRSGGRRRRCRLDRCRRRGLWARRGAVRLFLALLNRLENVTGFRDTGPVDLLRRALGFGGRGAAIAAAAALEMRADALRLIGFERARMRLGVRYSHFEQYVQNRLTLDFELSC